MTNVAYRHRAIAISALQLETWMTTGDGGDQFLKKRWLEDGHTSYCGVHAGHVLQRVAQALADVEHEALKRNTNVGDVKAETTGLSTYK